MNEIVLQEQIDYYRSPQPFVARLYKDGRFTVEVKGIETEVPWFKNTETQKPWFPKRSNFIALVKEAVRDGDYDHLLKGV